ncbi:MAG: hypothetical protein GXP38_01820, partial [Chloroflexi bacterium]|nr:hypothetical protein [Chloroflexota bacterium]
MTLLHDIITTLPTGRVQQVQVGLHWTAVVVESAGEQRCGLASTLSGEQDHHRIPDVPQAGKLETLPALELAALAHSTLPTEVSIGFATINALLPHQPEHWVEQNAEELIAREGAGKRVAMVGHFPFVRRLSKRVGQLDILEIHPQPGDLPASTADEIIPRADVVAITGMTLLNHTLEDLLRLCNPRALVSTAIFWYIIKFTMGLRVSEEEEYEGLDIGEHG